MSRGKLNSLKVVTQAASGRHTAFYPDNSPDVPARLRPAYLRAVARAINKYTK